MVANQEVAAYVQEQAGAASELNTAGGLRGSCIPAGASGGCFRAIVLVSLGMSKPRLGLPNSPGHPRELEVVR